jgi:ABC-2 type transport system permease protein
MSSILNMLSVKKIIPHLIMSFGLWLLYWLFTVWFRIIFIIIYFHSLVAGIFILKVSFIGILVSILIPEPAKADRNSKWS